MRKPDFCICKNKGVDQLHGNSTADQRLYFRYIVQSSTSQSQNFKSLAILYCIAQFVSDLVGNSKDRFSCDEAYLIINAFVVNCINGKINMYLLNKKDSCWLL